MKLHIRFVKSLFSPKNIAKTRIFGVGSTIFYILALTFFCMLPIGILFVSGLSGHSVDFNNNFQSYGIDQQQMNKFLTSMDGILPIVLMVIYVSMFVLFSGLLFSVISILAGIGILINRISKRNLSYRHLWVMTSYSITLPLLLLSLLFLFSIQLAHSFLYFCLLTVIILTMAIQYAPQNRTSSYNKPV